MKLKKIIKDKGLASRKKLMMNEMNNAGMSEGSSEEEEEEVQWLVHMYVAWTEAVHVCTQTVRIE